MSEFIAKVTAQLDISEAESALQSLSNTTITLNNIKPNTANLISQIQSALNGHMFTINVGSGGINAAALNAGVQKIGANAGQILSQTVSGSLANARLNTSIAKLERDNLKQSYDLLQADNTAKIKARNEAYQQYRLADQRYTAAYKAEQNQLLKASEAVQRQQLLDSQIAAKQQLINSQTAAKQQLLQAQTAAKLEQQIQRQQLAASTQAAREMSNLGSSQGLLTGSISSVDNIKNQLKDRYSTGKLGYGNVAVSAAGTISAAGREFQKFNVEALRADGTVQRYTTHVNSLTGEMYQLNNGIAESAKISYKASKNLPAISGLNSYNKNLPSIYNRNMPANPYNITSQAGRGGYYAGSVGAGYSSGLNNDAMLNGIYANAWKNTYGNTYKNTASQTLANGGSIATAASNALLAVNTQKINEVGTALRQVSGAAGKLIALPIVATAALSVKAFTDYETAFTGVRKTVDSTDEELQAVSDGLESMALKVPVASTELAGIAKIGGQLGIPTDHLLQFTEAFAGLQTATNLQGEDGAATFARFMNVMGENYDNIDKVGSTIVDLGNHTATTESEIATMATRMGSAGSIIGMSTADVLGYSAALSSLGVRAEMGGSAMTRIWQNIDTSVSEGGESLDTFAEKSKMSAEDFTKAWKSNPTQAFQALLKGLHDSDDVIGDLSDLGINNVRDIQSMEKLANGYDLVTSALNRANEAYSDGTALQVEADRAYNTTASKLKIAKEQIVQASRDVGAAVAPTVVDMAKGVSETAKNFANLDESTQKNIVSSALWTAGSIAAVNVAGRLGQTVATARTGFIKLASVMGTNVKSLGQVGLVIGGIAAAVVVGKKAYDAWYKSEYLWADGLDSQTKELQTATNSYTRLMDLRNQYKEAQATLTNPTASTSEIDAAKSKIEEIKGLLEKEYNLKITSDTGSLDKAFDMLSAQQRYNVMKEGSGAVEDMRDAAEGYKKSENELKEYDSKMNELQARNTKIGNLRLEAKKLDDAWKSGTISIEDYKKQFSELQKQVKETDSMLPEYKYKDMDSVLDTLDTEMTLSNRAISDISDKYSEAIDQREKFKAAVESSTNSYSQLLANDINQGDSDNINYDTTKLQEIGRTAREAGLNTDDLSRSFAVAKTGYTDFQDAITNGKAGEISQNFIDYKKAIGDFVGSEKDVVSQAALMKNGFSEVTPAVQQSKEAVQGIIQDMKSLGDSEGLFNGLGEADISSKLTEMAHSMELIPDSKHIEFDVETGNISVIDDLDTKIKEINKNSKAEVDLKVNGDDISIIDTTNAKLKELQANGADIKLKFNTDTQGFDILNGKDKIGTVTAEGKIEWDETEPPKVETPEPVEIPSEVIPPTSTPSPPEPDKVEYPSEVEEPQPAPPPEAPTVEYKSEVEEPQPSPAHGTIDYTTGNVDQPANPTADGTINYSVGSTPSNVPNASGMADFSLGSHPTSAPDVSGSANYTGNFPSSAPTIFGTIVYTIKTIGKAIFGGGGVDGTAHINGTATISSTGNAFAQGSWGTKSDGIALGGELGQELVVRNGRFFTIGDNSTEFFSYKKGDIIFNAEQTKQILDNGKITHGNRRGNALSDGTANSGLAFANGSDDKPEYLDWSEVAIDRIERVIKELDNRMDDIYNTFDKRNDALMQKTPMVKQEIDWQQQAYDRYIEQANSVGLSDEWATKVRDGEFNIDSITDDDLKDKINNYQKWYEKALDCKEAISDLRKEEKKLHKDIFDNFVTDFENTLSNFEHQSKILEEYFDRASTRGLMGSTKYYEAIQKNELKNLDMLKAEENSLAVSLKQAVDAGEIEVYSEAWYDCQQEIWGVQEAIEKSITSLNEFDNKMREITWDRFDYAIDAISQITDESDFLIDLLEHNDLYDENGSPTKYGTATKGLHGLNYNAYMEQANAYKTAIAQIDAELQNSPNDTNLISRRQELLKLQRENILAAEDEKDAIVDLVQDGIDKELDSLSNLIDKYTDALDAEKDLYDYRNQIADKTQDIASIQKQLAAYENDNSEETKATIQKLKVQLKEEKQNLEDMQYEQYIKDQKDLLESLYSQYEGILNENANNTEQLISDAIESINDNSSSIQSTLVSATKEAGTSLSSDMNKIWSSSKQVIKEYTKSANGFFLKADGYFDNGYVNIDTGLRQGINDILAAVNLVVYHASGISDLMTNPEKFYTAMKQNSLDWYTSDSNTQSQLSQTNNNFADYLGLSKDENGNYYDGQGNLFYNVSDSEKISYMVDAMKKNSAAWSTATNSERTNLENANARMANYISQISGENVSKDGNGTWWIGSQELYSAYKNGVHNLNKDEMAWTQEDGSEVIIRPSDGAILTPLSKGDSVLTSKASANLYDFANNPVGFMDNIISDKNITSGVPITQNGVNYQGDINFDVNLPNIMNYEQFKYAMQHDTNFEKMIKSMTVDRLVGGSSLKKYKY